MDWDDAVGMVNCVVDTANGVGPLAGQAGRGAGRNMDGRAATVPGSNNVVVREDVFGNEQIGATATGRWIHVQDGVVTVVPTNEVNFNTLSQADRVIGRGFLPGAPEVELEDEELANYDKRTERINDHDSNYKHTFIGSVALGANHLQ